MNKTLCELKISSYADSRDICAILAAHGYEAQIEERKVKGVLSKVFYVIVKGTEREGDSDAG